MKLLLLVVALAVLFVGLVVRVIWDSRGRR
jgi:hypothetical protein